MKMVLMRGASVWKSPKQDLPTDWPGLWLGLFKGWEDHAALAIMANAVFIPMNFIKMFPWQPSGLVKATSGDQQLNTIFKQFVCVCVHMHISNISRNKNYTRKWMYFGSFAGLWDSLEWKHLFTWSCAVSCQPATERLSLIKGCITCLRELCTLIMLAGVMVAFVCFSASEMRGCRGLFNLSGCCVLFFR